MKPLRTLIELIDRFTERVGRMVSALILVLIFTMSYEVGARYLFNSPTAWSYDLSYMIGHSMMLLGAGYTLLHGGHVRVDLAYERFPERVKALVDFVLSVVIFFPLVGALTYRAYTQAITAFVRGTRSDFGIWMPPMWPFRTFLAIGFTLLLIAGISWFIKSFMALRGEDK